MSFFQDFLTSYVAGANPGLFHQRMLEKQQAEELANYKEMSKIADQLFGRSPTKSAAKAFNAIKKELKNPETRAISPYDSLVELASKRFNVPKDVINRSIQVESNFNPNAVSPTGAKGLMQLFPAAAQDAGIDPSNLFDPQNNIMGGTAYLKQMLDRFGPEKAFQAYNQGPTSVASGKNTPEGLAYQQKFSDLLPMLADSGQQMQDSGVPLQQEQQPYSMTQGESKFLPNPMESGEGILGQDMDPMRRAWIEQLRTAFASGNPELVQYALKSMQDMQNSTMNDIERTSLQKNIASTNLQPGSDEYSQLIEKAISSPGQQININTGPGKPPEGYVWSPDAKELVRIPGGPADLTEKALTEDQSKNVTYSAMAQSADPELDRTTEEASMSASSIKRFLDNIPIIGEGVSSAFIYPNMSETTQLFNNAAANFVAGINRRESGATVTPYEWRVAFERYLPVYGDKPATIKWKSKNRKTAIKSMSKSSGPAGEKILKEMQDEGSIGKPSTDRQWKPGDGPAEGLWWDD